MFGTGPSQIKHDWWIYFIDSFITGAGIGLTPGGYVTPKSLCESLIPQDYPFVEFSEDDTQTTATKPNSFNKDFWPTDVAGWKYVIGSWGKITWSEQAGNQTYTVGDPDGWYRDTNNFLATWGIPPDSPMIMGFLTGWDMYQNSQLYARILEPLLGIKMGGSGGWWGFLEYGDNFGGEGMIEINRIVWSDNVPTKISVGAKKSKGCNVGSAVGGGIGGAGVGAMVAGAAAGSAGGLIGMLVGVLIGGIVGGTATAAANGCF